MNDDDRDDDGPVGYGRPPRKSQFKKGQSGNARGRPRKPQQVDDEPIIEGGLSAPKFNAMVLAEAERPVKVNGELKPTREAIMRSLAATAARGGVLAAKTWLELAEREETRLREVRLPVYESWASFKRYAKDEIAAAKAAGRDEPHILPHPDDIILDHDELLVKLVGPTTQEDLEFYENLRDSRDLFFELMMFTKTPVILYGDPDTHCVGVLGVEWISYHCKLPKRLRGMDKCLQRMETSLLRGRNFWADDLRERCELRGFDFDILGNPRFMRTFPMKVLGMRFENGIPVPANAKTRRMAKRLQRQAQS